MKGTQDINPASLYRFVIFTLTVAAVVATSLLFFINTGDGIHQQLLQKATAKGVADSSSFNTTDHAAGQNVESLVRSILSPVPSSSAINESGGNRTNESSAGSGHSKGLIIEKNTANLVSQTAASSTPTKTTIAATKNGNTTLNSSTTPLQSLSSLRSAINQPKSTNSTIKQGNNIQNTGVRNVHTLLLSHQIIPPKNFILLYSTASYKTFNGHLAAKIPCSANSVPSLQILVGHSTYLKPVQLHLVKEFSKPGNICMYNVDIGSETVTATTHSNNSTDKAGDGGGPQQQDNTLTNTVLVLNNPTDSTVILPNTSTVIIGVNEIIS
ncbi:MAG TPA: hypothetical protein VI278_13045 [Nitrososphaeraceae archaeon]